MGQILVTGGAGFIGSHLVESLLALGHRVVCLDNLSARHSVLNHEYLRSKENYSLLEVDLRSFDDVCSACSQTRPDMVFHLAAETHVDQSIRNPEIFLQSNVLGTANMLAALKELIDRGKLDEGFRMLQVSTDEVYGSAPPGKIFSETSAFEPNNPYSATKAAADHLARSWHKTYDFPVIVTHSANNFGPWQAMDKFVPVVIRSALKGARIPIYGTGDNVRDWIYVKDNVAGLIAASSLGETGQRYNLGAGNELSNLNFAETICKVLDGLVPRKRSYSEQIEFVADRMGHDQRYAISSDKLTNATGWTPSQPFGQALLDTIKWYLERVE